MILTESERESWERGMDEWLAMTELQNQEEDETDERNDTNVN